MVARIRSRENPPGGKVPCALRPASQHTQRFLNKPPFVAGKKRHAKGGVTNPARRACMDHTASLCEPKKKGVACPEVRHAESSARYGCARARHAPCARSNQPVHENSAISLTLTTENQATANANVIYGHVSKT